MHEFSFHRPGSVADAVALLKGSPHGKLLAGGQSYLPILKLGLASPTDLVSLRGMAELTGIRVDGGRLSVGAGETHSAVNASAVVQQSIKALSALAGGIGDAQVRNRGTIGGSLAHADPAADYPAALLALDAVVHTDRRQIPADGFFTGLFSSALATDEVITRVSFAIPTRAAYQKFPHPASKYAIVGVFVAQHASGVRVGVTGAKTNAFRWTAAEQALAARWAPDAVRGLAVSEADLNEDPDFSAAYRANLMAVLGGRAVAAT
ncbi:MAG: FAD binding domain-containing protein [Myxococcota bacterium]